MEDILAILQFTLQSQKDQNCYPFQLSALDVTSAGDLWGQISNGHNLATVSADKQTSLNGSAWYAKNTLLSQTWYLISFQSYNIVS